MLWNAARFWWIADVAAGLLGAVWCAMACASEPAGERVEVDLEVKVLRPDGAVAAGAAVQIVEMMGGMVVTGQESADENGLFKLRGEYCLPMVVAVSGGGIAIYKWRPSGKMVVIAKAGVPIERGYGPVDPDAATNVEKWRRSCIRG